MKHHSLVTSDDTRAADRDLLGVVKEEYENIVKNEVQRAIAADEDALKPLCGNYIDNVKAYTQREMVKNKFTGADEEPGSDSSKTIGQRETLILKRASLLEFPKASSYHRSHSRQSADREGQMADGRSKISTAKVEDVEKLHRALSRKLSRLRAMLDEIEASGKTKVRMEYWSSGVEADKKLVVFVRGVEASD